MNKLQVAVIGAGAAGLCAARYMAATPDRFEPVVFEKADHIGGTWVYTEETGKDQYGLPIHSSMYSSLKTNLPKEVMAFPDFPFDSKLPSFIKHSNVLEYLEQYAEHFNLQKYIQCFKVVESVTPIHSAGGDRPPTWEVKVSDVRDTNSAPSTSIYDAVIVCNGHYALPKVPEVSGLDVFRGKVLHSHDYRYPTAFENLSVLVVGANSSGIDISLDMSSHAKQVYLSHWKPRLQSTLPDNVAEVQEIKSFSEEGVECADGAKFTIDAVLFCTGYNYDFDFLQPECKLNVTDARVTPLYKHVIHTVYPSLSFIGITIRTCPFPHFSAQLQLVLAALEGSVKLPTREDMEADEARDYQKKLKMGFPHRYAHLMGQMQWEYNAEILRLAGADQHKPVIEKLYEGVAVSRRTDVCNYKKLNFALVDEENYIQLK